MPKLAWDKSGERIFETGVDRGVLYVPSATGVYDTGFAWNGLTAVNETPSGAESNKQYADNIVYLNLMSAEEFGGTIEAFTYPDEFAQFDGTAVPTPGLTVGQQPRKPFGFSYRTLMGNDLKSTEFAYKLHLVYGVLASPAEKAYSTVNESPEAMQLSWEFSTTPVLVTGMKPTSLITIRSDKVDATKLTALETILYGTDTPSPGTAPRLPLPDEVITLVKTP